VARRSEGIRLLLTGQSTEDVAEALGVGRRTVVRWRASDAYSDALAAKQARVAAAIENDTISVSEAAANAVLVMGRRLNMLARDPEPDADAAKEAADLFRALAAGKLELTGKGGGAVQIDHTQPLGVVLAQQGITIHES